MPECDMCGKDDGLVDAIVEGSMLSVCGNCAKYGNVIHVEKKEPVRQQSPEPLLVGPGLEVSDCAEQIKKAREKKGLTQQQLAKAIAEKESVIHRVESGKTKPTLKTASKLEQFLGIKLIEEYEEAEEQDVETKKLNLRDSEVTIGDLINMKKSTKE